MLNRNYEKQPYLIEKLVAAFSYITLGFVGFIWLILGLFTKSTPRTFLKYHIFQSIFLAIGYFLITQLLGIFLDVLSIIPFVNKVIAVITYYFNMPLIWGYSFIQACVYTVLFYLVVTSLQGKYSYLPWISEIIQTNVRS